VSAIRLARRRADGVSAGFIGTVIAHAAAVGILLFIGREPKSLGTVYAVKLIAAPATPPDARHAAPEAIPRPPERTAPIKTASKSAKTVPVPAKTTPRPRQQEDAAKATATTEKPNPGETPSTGTHVANVETPGAEFPYPDYLERIVNEIYRRWQRPAGSNALRAQIQFTILRDGTIKEIRVLARSRSYSFDLGAQGAIEAAGNARAFGPLPEGFPSDALQIALWFLPRGAQP
jgi:outer membrane biosynthesis protein TonB